MAASTHEFPAPIAFDMPILGPRSEREHAFPPRARRRAFWSSLGASAAVAIGALATKHRGVAIGASAMAGALAFARFQAARLFADDADYVVEQTSGVLEIRRYAKHHVAETDVDAGNFHEAMHEGYDRLSRYLREAGIAMSTPVIAARSDRRDWTTMRLRPHAEFVRIGPGRFTIRLIVPDHAPQATDARVHVREVPEHRVAALRFSGRLTANNIVEAHRAHDEAMTHALRAGRGEHMIAVYDPPTTPPQARRNEIWITLA